jgi:hypothetical protein
MQQVSNTWILSLSIIAGHFEKAGGRLAPVVEVRR